MVRIPIQIGPHILQYFPDFGIEAKPFVTCPFTRLQSLPVSECQPSAPVRRNIAYIFSFFAFVVQPTVDGTKEKKKKIANALRNECSISDESRVEKITVNGTWYSKRLFERKKPTKR